MTKDDKGSNTSNERDIITLAWELFDRKDYRLAINYAKQALKTETSNSRKESAYQLLIKGYSELGEKIRAKQYCLEELNAFPNLKDLLESIYLNNYFPCVEILWDIVSGQTKTKVDKDITEAESTLDLFVSKGLFTKERAENELRELKKYLDNRPV